MIVHVHEHHIDLGCPGDPGRCAIALAMLDAGFTTVEVGDNAGRLYLTGDLGGKFVAVEAPVDVVEFIGRFDAGDSVRPFAFSITLPA